VDIAAEDGFGASSLHEAAKGGHQAIVRLFIEKGANVAAKDSSGGTALHEAAKSGHQAVVQLLIEKGAKVTAKDYYNLTPLHFAAYSGNRVIVQLLLKHGADVNAKSISGDTALNIAKRQGHKEIIQLLIKGGAINAETPPLFDAQIIPFQNHFHLPAAHTPALESRPPPPPMSDKDLISHIAVRRTCGLCLGYLDFEPGSTEMCLCAGS
jgi:ankyrin repeat protein